MFTSSKDYVIDPTISDLEAKLYPAVFFRIHRATLPNLNYVTELQISRDRLRDVKARLEF